MRVAITVEQLLHPSPGGIGRYAAQLVSLLPVLFPEDRLLTLCARHADSEVRAVWSARALPTTSLPKVLPLPRPVLYQVWQVAGLPPLAFPATGLVDLDVVHATSVAVPPSGRYGLVVTVHDAAPERFPEAFTARGRRFHRLGMQAAARRADVVITPSEAAADEVVELSPVRREQIRVVPHGVVVPRIEEDGGRSRLAAVGLAGREYVLWVGSLEPRKDVGTLAAAMAGLHRMRPGSPALVLVGFPGWLNTDLIGRTAREALGDDLIELGPVDEATLGALYRSAALVALPSLHEGFGMPVLEAMAHGTAVVCSDLPSLREASGGCAELVPPGDVGRWSGAIAGLLEDEPTRRARIAAGLVWAREHSWEKAVAATRACYTEAAR
ncbi:MAG: glycosyltransferase family 4 protein [Acidimicrobiales bacterium]